MNETTCRKYFGELRSMMAELTATVFGIITDKYDGNRQLAQLVNRPVTDWIRDRWWHCINIVSTDFFLGNDLIRLAIHANRLRITRHNTDPNYYKCPTFRRIQPTIEQSFQGNRQWSHSNDNINPLSSSSSSSSNSRSDFNDGVMEVANMRPPMGRRWRDNQASFGYNDNEKQGADSFDHVDDSSVGVMIQTRSANDHIYRPHDRRTTTQQTTNTHPASGTFVDDLTDGFSNLFVSFKRLFNL